MLSSGNSSLFKLNACLAALIVIKSGALFAATYEDSPRGRLLAMLARNDATGSCQQLFMTGGSPPYFQPGRDHPLRYQIVEDAREGSVAHFNNLPNVKPHEYAIGLVTRKPDPSPSWPVRHLLQNTRRPRPRIVIDRLGYRADITVSRDETEVLYNNFGADYIDLSRHDSTGTRLNLATDAVIGDISDSDGSFITRVRNELYYRNAFIMPRFIAKGDLNNPAFIPGIDPVDTGFKDEQFDLLFSHSGELSIPYERARIPAAKLQVEILKEMLRILKVNGELRVGCISGYGQFLEELARDIKLTRKTRRHSRDEVYFQVINYGLLESHSPQLWVKFIKRMHEVPIEEGL